MRMAAWCRSSPLMDSRGSSNPPRVPCTESVAFCWRHRNSTRSSQLRLQRAPELLCKNENSKSQKARQTAHDYRRRKRSESRSDVGLACSQQSSERKAFDALQSPESDRQDWLFAQRRCPYAEGTQGTDDRPGRAGSVRLLFQLLSRGSGSCDTA